MNVIIRGDRIYEGHKDAWRAGVVTEGSLDTRGASQDFVTVICQPRGRERQIRVQQWPTAWLLKDTPEVRAKLSAHGIDPEKQPVTRS